MFNIQKRLAYWQTLLEEGQEKALLQLFQEAPNVEVAEFLAKLPSVQCYAFFLELHQDMQASLFNYFSAEKRAEVYDQMPIGLFAKLFEQMSSDVRADFYEQLNTHQQMLLLPHLSRKVRKDVLTLSAYAKDKVGSIMSTDFVEISNKMTVSQILEKLRKLSPSKKMMYFLYVTDSDRKLVGIVDLKELVLADPSEKITNLTYETLVFVNLDDEKEKAVHTIEKYDLVALPILNKEGQLVGILNYDDAMDEIREEEKEDMERFMGIMSDDERSYMEISSYHHFRYRIGWIVSLFALGTFASMFIHNYEAWAKQIFPTLFFSLIHSIADTGGNVGSQAAMMVVHAITLGHINLKKWLNVIYKEIKVGIMISFILFICSLVKVWVLITFFDKDTAANALPLWTQSMIFATTIALQVISSTLIGASLPLIMKKLGKDPNLAASPAITTLVDLTGIIIYFNVAAYFLNIT